MLVTIPSNTGSLSFAEKRALFLNGPSDRRRRALRTLSRDNVLGLLRAERVAAKARSALSAKEHRARDASVVPSRVSS